MKPRVFAALQRAGYVYDASFNMKRPTPTPQGGRLSLNVEKFAIQAAYRRNRGGASCNRYVPASRFYGKRAREIARIHPEWCRSVDRSLADLEKKKTATRSASTPNQSCHDLREDLDEWRRSKELAGIGPEAKKVPRCWTLLLLIYRATQIREPLNLLLCARLAQLASPHNESCYFQYWSPN